MRLVDAQAYILELGRRDLGGRALHEIGAAGGLGEGHDVADGVGAYQKHAYAVEAQGKAAHGRRAKGEGLKQEAKLLLGALGGEAQALEDLHLQVGVVDTQARSRP